MTMTGVMPAAPWYASPEAVVDGAISGGHDQYALGVIAFQALSGEFPHEVDTPVASLLAKTKGPARRLDRVSAVPRGVADAVARALERDPSRRFPTCGDFVAELQAGFNEAELSRRVSQAANRGGPSGLHGRGLGSSARVPERGEASRTGAVPVAAATRPGRALTRVLLLLGLLSALAWYGWQAIHSHAVAGAHGSEDAR